MNILILGSTGGIGQEITDLLTKDGHSLILHSKKDFNLEKDEDIKKLCDQVIKNYDKIDWIINSAGYISQTDEIENNFSSTFNINVFSIIKIFSHLKKIISLDGGIINISSTAGLRGNGKFKIYSSSKGALNMYATSLAKDFAFEKTNLKSIIISPGPTNTKMREAISDDATKHQSPEIIAVCISEILNGKSVYKNGSHIIIENNTVKEI